MSVTKIYSDQSRQLNWFVRQNTDATLTLTITQGAAAYNVSGYTYTAEFFNVNDLTTPITGLTLTQGSGITNGGASGILTLALTDTQLALLPNQYFWRLRSVDGSAIDNLWLNGIFQVNGYVWDGNTDSSAAIALTIGGDNINLAITIAGSGVSGGDVVGPSSSLDNEVVLFSGLTGKIIKASGLILANIAGNLTFQNKLTFSPSATLEGLNIGSLAGDPSAPIDGGLWYNSVTNKIMGRENGANVELSGGGGAAGAWLLASGGTLTGNNNILGAGTYELQLGTSASKLNYLAVNSEYIDINSDDDINFIGDTFNIGRPSSAYPRFNLYSGNVDVQTAALASQRSYLNLSTTSGQIKTARAGATGEQGYVSSYLTGASDAGAEIGAFSASFATSTIFQVWSTGHAQMGSTVAGFVGIKYENDYTANFVARSLIDKGYADATYAPVASTAFWKTASGGIATGTNTWNFGSNPWVISSSVTTGTGATAGIQGVFDALTTGRALDFSSTSQTTGTIGYFASTGTAVNDGAKTIYVVQTGANAAPSKTTSAGFFENSRTGSGTNIGIYSTVSGGGTNYSGQFHGGTGLLMTTNVDGGISISNSTSTAHRLTLGMTVGSVTGSFNTYGSTFSVADLAGLAAFGSSSSVVLYTDAASASGGTGTIKLRTGGYAATQNRLTISSTGLFTLAPTTLGAGTGVDISASTTDAASNTQKLLNVALSGANATSTQTTYGLDVTNSKTGTSSTNVALRATASGGTTNYAAQLVGRVSITTPTSYAGSIVSSIINAGAVALTEFYDDGTQTWYMKNSSGTALGQILYTLPGNAGPGILFRNGAGSTRYDITFNTTNQSLNIYNITNESTRVSIAGGATAAPTATLHIQQPNQSANWCSALRVTPGAHSPMTAATEFVSNDFAGAAQAWSDGTTTTQRFNYFRGFTLNKATTAATFTNPYTVYIEASTAGAGVTLTNNYALGISGDLGLVGTTSAMKLNGSAGTSGQVLTSAGAGATPTWYANVTHGVSAYLTLAAGTATVNTAPLLFTTGTNLTAAVSGAMEYNNTFHLTNSDATRRHVVLAPNLTKVTAGAPYTNDGYIVMNIGGTDFKLMTTA